MNFEWILPPWFLNNSDFWVIGTIGILSVFAVGIIIERFLLLMFRYSLNGPAFMAEIQKNILSNNIDRSIKLCNSERHAVLAHVIKAGLLKSNRPTIDIQNAVDEATLEVIPKLQKRTPYLFMIANVATLLGLFGTICGLIIAFKSIDFADAASRTDVLAKGIAIAMLTTATGLIVAIPSMLVHGVLQSKITQLIDEIDEYSVKIINLLSTRQKEQQRV